MKPDKHKKKDYLKADHSDCDFDSITKSPKIHQIKDEDKIDELPSKGKNNLAYRGRYFSNAVDRFLRGRIGDKWDDVYSDLIKKVGHEDNIKWRVDLNAYELDGKIVSVGYCGVQEVRGFYVLNGILGEKKRGNWYKRSKNDKVHVTFIDGFVVFKHKNLFFKAPIIRSEDGNDTVMWLYQARSYSNFERGENFMKYSYLEGRKRVRKFIHARYIRQLNHKELKNWELPNAEING